MNKIKNGFKLFIAIIIVLGGFNSVTAMEEGKKEYKEYKVISKELWQQILKDDALRERVLRIKVAELIQLKKSENEGVLSVSGAECFLCEIYHPDLEEDGLVTALKEHCNRRYKGNAYLTYIIGCHSREILFSQLLLLAGADVNAAGYRETPLHKVVMRARKGFLEKVELILNAGADVNIKTGRKKETALHAAVRLEKLNVVKLLLAHGARLDIPDSDRQTAMDRVKEENYTEIINFLQNWKKYEQD